MKILAIAFVCLLVGCGRYYTIDYANGISVRVKPVYVTEDCASTSFMYNSGIIQSNGFTIQEYTNGRGEKLEALNHDSYALGYTLHIRSSGETKFIPFCGEKEKTQPLPTN
jgi:hypothetical protein